MRPESPMVDRPDLDVGTSGPGGSPELDVCPMSVAEQRLWFLHRLQPDSTAYHIPAAWLLRGSLDIDALERAFQGIQARHEILRTTFDVLDDEPVQLISHAVDHRLHYEDLRGTELVADSEALRRRVREEQFRPFDLQTGPLFRTTLFQ